MSVIKVIELVGTSTKSWDDAVHQVVQTASKSIRHITGVDLVHQTAHCEEGRITEYRATVHLAFKVDEHSHLIGPGGARQK